MAIKGLPLDNNEVNDNNEKIVDLLGDNGKTDAFAGQPRPIATQLEEVTYVKSRLDGAIAAAPDKRTQLLTLVRLLTPLAESETQRERLESIRTYVTDSKLTDALKNDFVRAATAAKDEKRKPAKPFDVDFRRQQVLALGGPSRADRSRKPSRPSAQEVTRQEARGVVRRFPPKPIALQELADVVQRGLRPGPTDGSRSTASKLGALEGGRRSSPRCCSTSSCPWARSTAGSPISPPDEQFDLTQVWTPLRGGSCTVVGPTRPR